MITCNLSFSSETYLIGCSAILVVFKVVAREVAVQVVPYQADTPLCLPACKREGWERGEGKRGEYFLASKRNVLMCEKMCFRNSCKERVS